MQCNTDNRAIVCVTIKDSNKTPTPMEVKDKNQPHVVIHVLQTETHIVERNLGGVEVIDIHKLCKCPAKDEICHNCKVKGHFSAVCRNRNLSLVEEDNSTDSAFLDTVSDDDKGVWNTDLFINGKRVTFKIDTCAEVTVISKEHGRC